MVERGLVSHRELVECFEAAIDFRMDLTDGDFEKYVRRLNVVERDMFGIEPSRIDEPSWVR
jgi:hypothetical protein